MEISKNDSKMLQGLSVIAMVLLHLFNRDYQGVFTPLLFWGDIPIIFYLSQLSDFCVFGFAFLSGYAHMLQYGTPDFYNRRLKRLLSLLFSYWLILIVFSVISILIGQGSTMPGSTKKFILNAFLLESYNGSWWYMLTYVILVLISPLTLRWIKNWNLVIVLGISFGIYCVAYFIRFEMSYSNWFLQKFGPLGMTFFEYVLGAVAYKYRFFSWIYRFWQKIPKMAQWLLSVVFITGMLYGRTRVVPSLFVAPVTGFVLMTLFHFWEKPSRIKKFFLLIGEHSTNIWLIHMFFYLYLFKGLVYKANYPIFIFIFMLVITLLVSNVLKTVEKYLQNKFKMTLNISLVSKE